MTNSSDEADSLRDVVSELRNVNKLKGLWRAAIHSAGGSKVLRIPLFAAILGQLTCGMLLIVGCMEVGYGVATVGSVGLAYAGCILGFLLGGLAILITLMNDITIKTLASRRSKEKDISYLQYTIMSLVYPILCHFALLVASLF